jgi:hypothetical protein
LRSQRAARCIPAPIQQARSSALTRRPCLSPTLRTARSHDTNSRHSYAPTPLICRNPLVAAICNKENEVDSPAGMRADAEAAPGRDAKTRTYERGHHAKASEHEAHGFAITSNPAERHRHRRRFDHFGMGRRKLRRQHQWIDQRRQRHRRALLERLSVGIYLHLGHLSDRLRNRAAAVPRGLGVRGQRAVRRLGWLFGRRCR